MELGFSRAFFPPGTSHCWNTSLAGQPLGGYYDLDLWSFTFTGHGSYDCATEVAEIRVSKLVTLGSDSAWRLQSSCSRRPLPSSQAPVCLNCIHCLQGTPLGTAHPASSPKTLFLFPEAWEALERTLKARWTCTIRTLKKKESWSHTFNRTVCSWITSTWPDELTVIYGESETESQTEAVLENPEGSLRHWEKWRSRVTETLSYFLGL